MNGGKANIYPAGRGEAICRNMVYLAKKEGWGTQQKVHVTYIITIMNNNSEHNGND